MLLRGLKQGREFDHRFLVQNRSFFVIERAICFWKRSNCSRRSFVMSDLRESLTVPLFKKINESKRAKSERSKERIPNPGRKHGGKSGKERWKNNFIFLGRAEQSSGFYQVSDSELKVWICPLWRNITKAADQTLFDSKPADWHEDRK